MVRYLKDKQVQVNRKSTGISRKKAIVVGAVLLLLAAGLIYRLEFQKSAVSTTATNAPVKPAPARSKSYVPVVPTGSSQGGAIDKHGAATAADTATDESSWKTSTSGLITLQQPIDRAEIASGDTIRGVAQVSTVQYRLVDDSIGVLAQGSLNVVNGKFSGILQFSHKSSTGQLKVFSLDPQTGAEKNHADIIVNFGS
jgi:hypothetical protein